MSDRVAVVVGGASGIGWASAQALAADGCRVTIADRNTDLARRRAEELGDPHSWAAVEVSDEDSVQVLFDGVADRGFPLSVHFEATYGVNTAAFETLAEVLAYWSPDKP